MRGSDVDAALHYLARMLEAGEDPRFIARRIVIAASEEVGMADPTALQTAVAALHAVAQIGMPEARIILAQAVVHNALAPKSNASYAGINAAIADIRAGKGGPVPPHLRGSGYAGADPPRARRGIPLRPRRPGRGRGPAVPPGRPGPGRRLLPPHRPRLRGTARTTLEVAAGPDPRSVTICHIRVPECWNPPMACGTFTPSRGEGVTSPQQGAAITMLCGRPVHGHTPSGRRAHVARFREHGHGGGNRGGPHRAARAGGRRHAPRPFAVPDRLRPAAPRQGRDRVPRHRRVLRARRHLRAAAVQAGGSDPHGLQPGPDRRGHAAAHRPDLRPLVRRRAAAGTRPVRPLGVRRAAVAHHRLRWPPRCRPSSA